MVIVVTNQPDVRTGIQKKEVLDTMHSFIRKALNIDDIKVCLHIDEDKCDCRKPKPGMLLDASHEHGIQLSDSFMVGDRWKDIDAGKNAGCRTILIKSQYEEKQANNPDCIAASLLDAVSYIMSSSKKQL